MGKRTTAAVGVACLLIGAMISLFYGPYMRRPNKTITVMSTFTQYAATETLTTLVTATTTRAFGEGESIAEIEAFFGSNHSCRQNLPYGNTTFLVVRITPRVTTVCTFIVEIQVSINQKLFMSLENNSALIEIWKDKGSYTGVGEAKYRTGSYIKLNASQPPIDVVVNFKNEDDWRGDWMGGRAILWPGPAQPGYFLPDDFLEGQPISAPAAYFWLLLEEVRK